MSLIRKTFGGLKWSYLIKQYIFSAILFCLTYMLFTIGEREIGLYELSYFIVNALLYPYSRWIYEFCVEFITGGNIFIFPMVIFLFAKFFTMYLCWVFAIFVAPIGLIALYIYQTKQEKDTEK